MSVDLLLKTDEKRSHKNVTFGAVAICFGHTSVFIEL